MDPLNCHFNEIRTIRKVASVVEKEKPENLEATVPARKTKCRKNALRACSRTTKSNVSEEGFDQVIIIPDNEESEETASKVQRKTPRKTSSNVNKARPCKSTKLNVRQEEFENTIIILDDEEPEENASKVKQKKRRKTSSNVNKARSIISKEEFGKTIIILDDDETAKGSGPQVQRRKTRKKPKNDASNVDKANPCSTKTLLELDQKFDAEHEIKCDIAECSYVADSLHDLRPHYLAAHAVTSGECEVDGCDFSNEFLSNLRQHYLSKHGIFKCRECTFSTSFFYSFKSHIWRHDLHNSSRYYGMCDKCGHVNLSYDEYNLHKTHCYNKCLNAILKCKFCEYENVNKHNVVYHYFSVHRWTFSLLSYTCGHCPYTSSEQIILENHFSEVHKNESELFRCEKCCVNFNTSVDFKVHSLTLHVEQKEETEEIESEKTEEIESEKLNRVKNSKYVIVKKEAKKYVIPVDDSNVEHEDEAEEIDSKKLNPIENSKYVIIKKQPEKLISVTDVGKKEIMDYQDRPDIIRIVDHPRSENMKVKVEPIQGINENDHYNFHGFNICNQYGTVLLSEAQQTETILEEICEDECNQITYSEGNANNMIFETQTLENTVPKNEETEDSMSIGETKITPTY